MLSVIIPNWNGGKWLGTCLNALRQQTFQNFETIVVDNGSTDGSLELLARDYSEVRVLPLAANRGFAPAVNEGIRAARGEIVVLLNNDTEADPHWLEEIMLAFRQQPAAGMVACKLRQFDRRTVLTSAGDFCRVVGIPGMRGVWVEDCGQYETPDSFFGALGAAAAYRKSMLDEIGLLDEEYVSYLEDMDLNWRARLAGFACAYAPRAIVYHVVSATGGGPLASYYVGRNTIAVLAKNYPAGLWKKYWPRIVLAQLRIARDALGSIRGAAARARLKGQLAGLVGLPHWLNKRKQVIRRAGEQEIEQALIGAPPRPPKQPTDSKGIG
jgi:GT2 family glycosyltransferase